MPRMHSLSTLSNFCVDNTDHVPLRQTSSNKAILLLCGIPESKVDYEDTSSFTNLMVVEGQVKPLLTCLHLVLLTYKDNVPKLEDVYYQGAERFKKCQEAKDEQLLIKSPLEAAYAWVLACQLAQMESLTFAVRRKAKLCCSKLIEERLFKGTSSDDFFIEPKDLAENTI